MKSKLLFATATCLFATGFSLNARAGHRIGWHKLPTSEFAIGLTPQEAEKELPPMPGLNSPQDRADLTTLLQWQKERTSAQCERARGERDALHAEKFFGPKYHVLTAHELKVATPILHQAFLLTAHFVFEAKNDFKRPRPYISHNNVEPCVGKSRSFSYPSGHTTVSRVMALVLSDIDPAHGAQYLERADQVARDRILAGVHYPTDIRAGKKLADLIFAQLSKNARFEQDVEKIKAEWR